MTSLIITLLIVFYRVPLINLLGDKGMGYYSIALVVYLLLMTCIAYGLPKAVSMMIAEQSSKGQYDLVYKTVKSALIYALAAGGGSALLMFLCSDVIASFLMNASYSSYALCAFAPCLIFISVLGVLHGIYGALKANSFSKSAHLIEEFFVAVLSIVGAYIFTGIGTDIAKTKGDLLLEPAYSAMGASIGLTLGVFIACLYSWLFFSKYRKKIERMAQKDISKTDITHREIIRTLLITMIPFVLTLIIFHISSIVDYAVFNRIMSIQGHKENSYIILLGMLNGKYEFFISLPLLVVNWFAASKVPMLTKIAQEGNKRKIYIKINQYLRHTMLFTIPCTAMFIVFSTPLMNFIFTGINDTPSIMLKTGAVSIIFYSLAAISNAALNALNDWFLVAKNALLSLVVQLISLLFMMVVFQWGIIAVVISRAVFSSSLYIFNEHTLRERTGYIQDYRRTIVIPVISSLIMSGVSFVIYFVLELFLIYKIAIIIAIVIGILIYIFSLIFLGGITQREMYHLPGGKYLAPLCRKMHLLK